jgi:flagellar basal body-associated protein FliL
VTLALDPFLLTIPDANRKVHPMKVTLAIEFDSTAKEDALKALVPRVRDSTLGYLRTLTFEAALDPAASDKMRGEVLERIQGTAAPAAQRVLITDLVVQ